jgi:zinc protease
MKPILALLLITMSGLSTYAQIKPDAALPTDPKLRVGKLPNGLTYYIRHNNFPKGLADFQIFHSVGAMQEEDNQNGLAHFLEHQAFKGLAHFPGKSMTNYMEKIGVKFGENLNAATTTDYTRYMINQVPISRQGIIDTCLLVLSDWSGSITANPEAVDSERGVIKEEWRMRGGVDYRINQGLSPYFFKGSKYAIRSVIGDMKIIETFKQEELLDFYHKWYRPDLQAVAIVGDFDVDAMEAAVKKLFSKLPKAVNPTAKTAYPLPDNKELIYGTYSDKEASSSSISLMFKHPQQKWADRQKPSTYTLGYQYAIITSMMNSRWEELSHKKDFAIKGLQYGFGSFVADKDVFSVSADVKPGVANIMPAFDMMLSETERFKRYGFTKGELDLVKANFKRRLERSYLERDKKPNNNFIESYMNNFLENTPMISAEVSYKLFTQVLDNFTLAQANAMLKGLFTEQNVIATVVTSTEDAAGIPSRELVVKKLAGMSALPVEIYKDKALVKLEPKTAPKPGKVISEQKVEFGATLWTLANGAKVYLLPTPHKKDELMMTAYSKGGHSVMNDKDYFSARLLTTAMLTSGVGNLSSTELSNALAGKIVYVTPFLSELSESIDCSTTPSDAETMLKLVYMYFTEPRFDEAAFKMDMKKTKENLVSRKKNPFSALQDSVTYIRSNHHYRSSNLILDANDIDKVDFSKMKDIHKQVFGNPADFVFVFTGAIDLVKVKPMIEEYVGGLSATHRKDEWRDVGKRSPKGPVTIEIKQKMETPKSTTFIEYTREAPYSFRRAITMQLLQGIIDIRFNKLLRDERSGVYSTMSEASIVQDPLSKLQLIVSFETDPKLMDELTKVVHQELKRLAVEGVDAADLAKGREFMNKSRIQRTTNNGYWHHILYTYATKNGVNNDKDAERVLNEIDAKEVKAILAEILEPNNVVTVTMRPE